MNIDNNMGWRRRLSGTAFLLIAGVILAWPILTGAWLTYLDNPAHIAELHSLAFDGGGGWSDIAWCGYPLGRLHSPVWFAGTAALLRAGAPLDVLYPVLVFLGFVAPALALFGVSRGRSAGFAWAAALAWLLMVQRPALVGFGSPLGGMWTFFLSAAGLILLMAELARPERNAGRLPVIAAVIGLVGLTHLFTIVPVVLVFLAHVVRGLRSKEPLVWLAAQSAAAALGAAAAAAYWVPLLLAGDGMSIEAYNLPPVALLARLLLATKMPLLITENPQILSVPAFLGAWPQVLLVAAGIAGFAVRPREGRADLLPWYGFLLGCLVLALLLVLGLLQSAGHSSTLLGHVSWRLLYFVRIGAALAALPLLPKLSRALSSVTSGWRPGVVAALACGVLLAASFGLGHPLRQLCLAQDDPQMTRINGLWDWLAANPQPQGGRTYLQDPFGRLGPLGNSHVMALTAMKTGARQVGPLYAGSPFATRPWLVGESGALFGRLMRNNDDFLRMQRLSRLANATRLVLFYPELSAQFVESGHYRLLHRRGDFTVLEPVADPLSRWAEPLAGGVEVVSASAEPGLVRMQTRATDPAAPVLVKVSYSPHWRGEAGGPDVVLQPHETGLMQVSGLPAGTSAVTLRYRQPRWPDLVSLSGWLLLAVMAGLLKARPRLGGRLAGIPSEKS